MAGPWLAVPPLGYGGSELVVDLLARGFSAAGHEVMLWTTGDSTCPVPSAHLYPTAQMSRIGQTSCELQHLVHGYEMLSRWGAEIVHDHTAIGPLFARRNAEFVVVATNHGPFDVEAASLYRALAGEVPVVAISHDQATRAPAGAVAAVIHHGIDVDAIPPGDGAGDECGPYFAFLGRMAPDKGVHTAIDAARAAGVRLLIAAKMREPDELRYFTEVIEPTLGSGIEYVGEVCAQDKPAFLGAATALVNPIEWPEPFGLVMVESMAAATPVIARPVGSAPELIDEGVTGLLCDDHDQITEALSRVANIDRTRCRASAAERFSSARMVAEHLELFESLIGHPSRPPLRLAGSRR